MPTERKVSKNTEIGIKYREKYMFKKMFWDFFHSQRILDEKYYAHMAT